MLIEFLHLMPGGVSSALCWSIDVQQTARRALVEHFTNPNGIRILSAEKQMLQRLESVWNLTRELIEKSRCQEQGGNFLFRDLRGKIAWRKTHVPADDH